MSNESAVAVNQENTDRAIRDLAYRAEAGKRASADSLPGPLASAFGSPNIQFETFTVRPLVAYDWAILKATNSPLHLQMLEYLQHKDDLQNADQIEFTEQGQWEMIYLLTRSCEKADEVFEKGTDVFKKTAKREIGMSLNPAQVVELFVACQEQVRRSMETMVKYAPPEEDASKGNGEVKSDFFSSAAPPPATVSAGGSTT